MFLLEIYTNTQLFYRFLTYLLIKYYSMGENLYIVFLEKAFKNYIKNNSSEQWAEYKEGFLNISIKNVILPIQKISGFDFSNVNFTNVYFSNWNIENSFFVKTNFLNSFLSYSFISTSPIDENYIYNTSIDFAVIKNCRITNSTFSYSSLEKTIFEECYIENIEFQNCNMENVRFKNCKLQKVSFYGSNLKDTHFINTYPENCDFKETFNFSSAHFSGLPQTKKITPHHFHKHTSNELEYHLNILSLPPDFDENLLSKRFRELAKNYHPDRYAHDKKSQKQAEAVFKKIQESYLYLCDYLNRKKTNPVNMELTKENLLWIIKQNPQNDIAYYNLGILYFREGNYRKSIECYKKALELNPHNQMALHNLKITSFAQTLYKSVSKRK